MSSHKNTAVMMGFLSLRDDDSSESTVTSIIKKKKYVIKELCLLSGDESPGQSPLSQENIKKNLKEVSRDEEIQLQKEVAQSSDKVTPKNKVEPYCEMIANKPKISIKDNPAKLKKLSIRKKLSFSDDIQD